MKRLSLMIAFTLFLCLLTACGGEQAGGNGSAQDAVPGTIAPADTEPQNTPEAPAASQEEQTGQENQSNQTDQQEDSEMTDEIKVKITVGETELTAVFEDNTTSRALVEQMGHEVTAELREGIFTVRVLWKPING